MAIIEIGGSSGISTWALLHTKQVKKNAAAKIKFVNTV